MRLWEVPGENDPMNPGLPTLPIRDERVRRIAVSAAKGGGGLLGVGTALAGAAIGVVAVQARLAKRAIGPRRSVPPYADGRYFPNGDRARGGTSLRLAVLGDSGAAGLGAHDAASTPGAVLAAGLASAADRPVVLTNAALVGARSSDLEAQVDRVLVVRPHVAMIMIGANDVTHLVRPQDSVRHLADAVRRLRAPTTAALVSTTGRSDAEASAAARTAPGVLAASWAPSPAAPESPRTASRSDVPPRARSPLGK